MPGPLNAPLTPGSLAIGNSDWQTRPPTASQPCQLPAQSRDSAASPTLLQGLPSALPCASLSAYCLYGRCSSVIPNTWLLPSGDEEDTFPLLMECTVELAAGVQSGGPGAASSLGMWSVLQHKVVSHAALNLNWVLNH